MGILKKEQLAEKEAFTLPLGQGAPGGAAFGTSQPASTDDLDRLTPHLVDKATEDFSKKKMQALRAQADQIIAATREQVKTLREEAKREGQEAGRAAYQEKMEEVFRMLREAAELKKKVLRTTEPEILRLSLKVAEQIVRSEVSLHRDVCLNIASDAIGRVSDRERILLKVNRDDVEVIKKYKDRIAGIVDGIKTFSIVEDTQVEAGGCVIETSLGYVDARISTKLSLIEAAWEKLLEEQAATEDLQEELAEEVGPAPAGGEAAASALPPVDQEAGDEAKPMEDSIDSELPGGGGLDDEESDDLDAI